MSILLRILMLPITIISWPFRMITRLFTRSAVGKGTTGYVASGSADYVDTPKVEPEAISAQSFLFRRMNRPKTKERDAADLGLDEIRAMMTQSNKYYRYDFSLFESGNLFYEQVERSHLEYALGDPDGRFTSLMDMYRKVINDNVRRLMMWQSPLILAMMMVIALGLRFIIPADNFTAFQILNFDIDQMDMVDIVSSTIASIIGVLTFILIYKWPYTTTQRENLLSLDNYLTSKFSRINQNFQVCFRHAMNVEKEKRMNEKDDLKDEAGLWTVAYHWTATRLLLCEMLVRNKIYQVKRNSFLYWFAGIALCIAMASVLTTIAFLFAPQAGLSLGICFATMSVLYLVMAYGVLVSGIDKLLSRVLQSQEWQRFSSLRLDESIAEHVGEDKVQIITFRDRNRME